MVRTVTKTKDDDDDGKMPVVRGGTKPKASEKEPEVPPAGVVVGPLPEGMEASDMVVVDPHLASDVAGGFTPGTVPGSDKISAIKTDTPTYGTETPPRQTPPTSIDNAMKHSPPSFHDSNGAKIVSAAPTLTSISPTTGTALSATPITVTLTGTNFDRATFATVDGVIQSQSAYVSATSMTVLVDLKSLAAGVHNITAKNSAGESVQRALTLS
jgi:hypothetical protein